MLRPATTGFLSGRIAYLDASRQEVGREAFEIISYPGGRTVRALCELDDSGLVRDATLSLDDEWRPNDGFCRVILDGTVVGSAFFLVKGEAVEFEGDARKLGRLSQRFFVAGGLRYLGLHPLIGDALIVAVRGMEDPGRFQTIRGITNSIAPNGDEGLFATFVDIDVAFIGLESIAVLAGSFDARHFQLRWSRDWPPADLWVRLEDFVFLKMTWTMIDTSYELTDLQSR